MTDIRQTHGAIRTHYTDSNNTSNVKQPALSGSKYQPQDPEFRHVILKMFPHMYTEVFQFKQYLFRNYKACINNTIGILVFDLAPITL